MIIIIIKTIIHQVSSSVWMKVADRSESINLNLLEEMFQIEEKEKTLNAGKLNEKESGIRLKQF